MPRLTRWDTYVRCGQGVPFTRDGECNGRVRVWGHRWTGNATTGAQRSEPNVGACDTCGFADWSPSEAQEMTTEAQGNA